MIQNKWYIIKIINVLELLTGCGPASLTMDVYQ